MPKLYFVTDGKYVKIGHSQNPRNRLSAIQVGCPYKLELMGYFDIFSDNNRSTDLEKLLHGELKKYHHRGEWFKLTPGFKKYIELMIQLGTYFPQKKYSGNAHLTEKVSNKVNKSYEYLFYKKGKLFGPKWDASKGMMGNTNSKNHSSEEYRKVQSEAMKKAWVKIRANRKIERMSNND